MGTVNIDEKPGVVAALLEQDTRDPAMVSSSH